MRVLKLREKLGGAGLLLLEHGDAWLVTDNGVKTPLEKEFKNLDAVEAWFDGPARRLTDEEADEFDEDWKKFVVAESK